MSDGPVYDVGSAPLTRYRRLARDGIMSLPREHRVAYADAVEAAIHASNNAWWKRGPTDHPKPYSGAQRLAQLRTALSNCPSQIRRARTPQQWREMYEAAMKEKMLNSTTTIETAASFLKASRSSSLLIKDYPICSTPKETTSSQPRINTRSAKNATISKSAAVLSPSKPPSRSTNGRSIASSSTPKTSTDLAAKRSAAAYKAHETRRRMKAEAEAQASR